MKRRQFITLLGGVATWPLAARAKDEVSPANIALRDARAADMQ